MGQGVEVVCVDDLSTGQLRNLDALRDDARFRFVEGDVSAGIEVPDPERVDLVLHLASPASPVDYLRLPLRDPARGVGGDASRPRAGRPGRGAVRARLHVRGLRRPGGPPQREDYWGHVNPVGPRSVYDESKRFAEATTAAYRRSRGVDTGIVRIFNTYGPRMRGHDGRMVPTFVRQALAGEPLTVAGDGSQTRSVCFVDDLVEGILAFARTDHPGPVNLGDPTELTVERVARDVLAATGSDARIVHVDLPGRPAPSSAGHEPRGAHPRLAGPHGVDRGPRPDGRVVPHRRWRRDARRRRGGARRRRGRGSRPGMKVSVHGCGYLGAVHAAALARLGHEVVGIDVDPARVAALAEGRAPFFEPGLAALLADPGGAGRSRSRPTSRTRASPTSTSCASGRRSRRAAASRTCSSSRPRSRRCARTCARGRWWSASRPSPSARPPGSRQTCPTASGWPGTPSSCARGTRSRTRCTRTGSSTACPTTATRSPSVSTPSTRGCSTTACPAS